MKIQEVICQQLNLPFINLAAPGGGGGGSQAQVPGSQAKPGGSQTQDGANISNSLETTANEMKGNLAAVAQGGATDAAANQAQQSYQDSSVLHHFREMQRRQIDFMKKRVLLLEKALNAEYQKEFFVSSFLCFTFI